MAKRRPHVTLLEMEKELGFQVEVTSDDIHEKERFYSDLSPVSKNIYERTEKELLEHRRIKHKERQVVSDSLLPRLGETHISLSLTSDEATITLNRRADFGYFVFSLDVHFSFGLVLPFILTEMEASKVISMTRLEKKPIDKGYGNAMSLPHELRLDILDLAIPKQEWEERDPSAFLAHVFPGSIGDLSGFYFPLSRNMNSLLVNKQIRQDALPFAYRMIDFRWDDIDSFIKFAISIGKIGRNNVESLELFWLSNSDSEFTPSPEDIDLRLPAFHVLRCVQLLKQFNRLRHLRLIFDDDLLSTTPCEIFKSDSGIRELSSIKGIQLVEIWGFDKQALDRKLDCAKWLKEELQCQR